VSTNRSAPQVCISVLNWNGAAMTIRCLESLMKLDYPRFEIVVVDNASVDDSVQQIQAAFPAILLIRSPENLGFAGGHRLAVERAMQTGAELIWLLNNDTIVQPDALAALVDACQRHGAALYGSVAVESLDTMRIVFGGGWKLNPATGNPLYKDYNPLQGRLYQECFPEPREQVVADLNGSSLLIPLDVIRQHGFMDESFFMYAEETDYCIRMAKCGVPSILVPASIVAHGRKGASRHHPRLVKVLTGYYQRRNQLIIKRRYRGRRLFWSAIRGYWKTCWKIWLISLLRPGAINPQSSEVCFNCLAARDAALNRIGKRFDPEDFLD
jgi:GT2 family glycosyltransferase